MQNADTCPLGTRKTPAEAALKAPAEAAREAPPKACPNAYGDFEVGGHDGAYKGRVHVIVPFIGRKNGSLTSCQTCYNDVHGWYRRRIEQLFARFGAWLGTFGVAAPVSCTSPSIYYCIFLNFVFGGRSHGPMVYGEGGPPHRPWDHVPPRVWTAESNSAATEDEGEDEVEVC